MKKYILILILAMIIPGISHANSLTSTVGNDALYQLQDLVNKTKAKQVTIKPAPTKAQQPEIKNEQVIPTQEAKQAEKITVVPKTENTNQLTTQSVNSIDKNTETALTRLFNWSLFLSVLVIFIIIFLIKI